MPYDKTYVKITNDTSSTVKLSVSDVDSYDWDGSERPDEKLNKQTIANGDYIRRNLSLNANARSANYTLSVKSEDGSSINLRINQRWATYSSYSDYIENGGIYCKIFKTNKDDNLLHIYLYSRLHDELTFYVVTDTHITANGDDEHNQYTQKIKEQIKAQQKNGVASYIIMPGDLTNQCATREDGCFDFDWSIQNEELPVICEGYGNHDMFDNYSQLADLSGLIRSRNNLRRTFLKNQYFSTYTNNLHYKWAHILSNGRTGSLSRSRVHFFMLNLLPAYGNNRNRLKNAESALDYLQMELRNIDKNEPIFLFHHYGFFLADDNAYDKYWDQEDIEKYLEVIKDYAVAGIFYGHKHQAFCHGISKYPQILAFSCGAACEGDYTKVTVSNLSNGVFDVKVELIDLFYQSSKEIKYTYNHKTHQLIYDRRNLYMYTGR